MKLAIHFAAALSLLCATAVSASEDARATTDDTGSAGGLGLRVGTAGLAVDYTYGLNRYVDLRAGYHFGAYSADVEEDGIDYDGKLKINAAALMVDVKPFAGGFRITGGLYTASPELTLKASGRNDYDVGSSTYTGDLRLDGDVDLGSAAPYLGIGWGGTTNGHGFGASVDLGVMFTASPDVTLDVTGRACDATLVACDPNGPTGFNVDDPNDPRAQQFQADKDEEIRNLEEDAKDFKLWPVLMVGLHYRF
ncbi:MAG TPA: hypothetical protein VGE57_13115 [Solimonas sp.]